MGAPALPIGGGQQQRQRSRAFKAGVGHGQAGRPDIAFPLLRPGGGRQSRALARGRHGRRDDVARFRKPLQRLALHAGGQAADAHLQALAVAAERGGLPARRQIGRQAAQRLLERRAIERRRAAQRQANGEIALLRNAFLLAHQPGGVQAHFHRLGGRAWLEFRRDGQRHGQQHRALVAIVHQRPQRKALRQRPLDFARAHAGRQRPLQLGGQARIARVLPVGMPMRLMLQPQAQPHGAAGGVRCFRRRRAHGHALRRVSQQLRAHLRRGHLIARRTAGQHIQPRHLRGRGRRKSRRQQGGQQMAHETKARQKRRSKRHGEKRNSRIQKAAF